MRAQLIKKPHPPSSKSLRAAIVLAVLSTSSHAARAQSRVQATISVDTAHAIAAFDPRVALGSTIDGHYAGGVARAFKPGSVRAMRSANFGPISYRLRTELGVEAWHWNPGGTWSDAAHARGYWTSDARPGAPIRMSYGYKLPRRGDTIDQANEEGWSRIDDGDTTTFWKSNPYLDSAFTGESNERHPQWVVIDLGERALVNAVRIHWRNPFATRYDVQYFAARDEEPTYPDDNEPGAWVSFGAAAAHVTHGHGGVETVRVEQQPRSVRWIRVVLRAGSCTAEPGSRDVRDSLGYAIDEIYAGVIDANGRMRDAMRHGAHADRQTTIFVSSTDPWHRAADRDPNTEQPGIDLLFASTLTRGLPALLPVGSLYDTPANAAAFLAYVRARRYNAPRIEIGEEPDGQFVLPEDFAALYLQTARALRRVDSAVVLGGPSLQNAPTYGMLTWRNLIGDETRSWARGFLGAIRDAHRESDLRFLSFEWYPFDSVCVDTPRQIESAPAALAKAMRGLRDAGLSDGMQLDMTEYGYSAFSGAQEVDLAGAIFNAEAAMTFLQNGGSSAFFYGTEPSDLEVNEMCRSWGNNTLFLPAGGTKLAPTATYYAAHLVTSRWADSAGGPHAMLAAHISGEGLGERIGAYAVRRPDRTLALLLVNRDSSRGASVAISGMGARLAAWQMSRATYRWRARDDSGYASPNEPPRYQELASAAILLPPYSMTVIAQRR